MSKENLAFDNKLRKQYPIIAGCDEVGRGCLAGPVITAVVILPQDIDLPYVTDSKKIKKSEMKCFAEDILKHALDVQIGVKTAKEIDETNILQADKDAMIDSLNKLKLKPDLVIIDGDKKQLLDIKIPQRTIIKGDNKSLTIGAASIVAKSIRDELMKHYATRYPEFGFETNAGYGTVKHKQALLKYGITPIHRKTFAPIKNHEIEYKTYDTNR